MKTVHVTDEVAKAIRARAILPFRQTGIRRPDGSWDIPFADDTLERITAAAFPGESISDTLLRVLGTYGKGKN